MSRETVSFVLSFLLLISTLAVASKIQPANAGLYGPPSIAPNGRSFGVSTKISGIQHGAYARVATDSVGGVYATWYTLDTFEVYFTCSHDYGRSWGPIARISGGGNPRIVVSDADVAVDQQNGYVYVVWIDNRSGHWNVYLCTSIDHGASLGSVVMVNNVDGSKPADWDISYSTHVAAANGAVYVAWTDNRTDPSYTDIYLGRSTDGGHTFGINTRVNPYEAAAYCTVPWVTVDEAGVVYVAYTKDNTTESNVFLTRSLDGGLSFKVPAKVNDDSLYCYRGKKEVAVSKDGKVYVVWTDGRNATNWDIYFATSLDGGLSFGPNVCVNDDSDIPPQNVHGTPSLVLDRTGGINVVWEDFRNFNATPTYYRDVYYAFSEDGKQFSENVKVNYVPDATVVSAADPNIAVDSNDSLYIVWSDTPYNESNLGIYFAFSSRAIPGDINSDGKVSLADLAILAQAYGSKPGDSNWNSNADIDGNGVVGLSDLVILAQNYGQHYP